MRVERFATTQAAGASVDLQRREFEGLGVAYGRRSEGGGTPTIFRMGAFAKTLKEMGSRVKILFSHDHHQPLGRPLWIRETPEGLLFRAKLDDIPKAHDVLKLLKSGTLDELSVGVDVIKSVDTAEGRLVTEARLWEVSVVVWGAVPGSSVFRYEGNAALPTSRPKPLTASLADKLAHIAAAQAQVNDSYIGAISRRFS